jgi:recombination protein RecA
VVEKRGSWISYGTEQLGQGTMATMEFLKTHPDVTAEIVEKVKAAPLQAAAARKK